jgi:hypothetical protein
MQPRLLIALLLFTGYVYSAEPEIHFKGWRPLDVKREIVFIRDDSTLRLVIRNSESQKEIGSDTLDPVVLPTEADPDYTALWSPNGEYVAFNLQEMRHNIDVLIYRVTSKGIERIELPNYWKRAQSLLGHDAEFRGGTETPVRWNRDNTLVVQSVGQLRDQSSFDLFVTFELRDSKATLRSVTRNQQ